ncbi:MAG TPA: NmrA/HSCARG family protein [Thermoplasmata archaeon]|nr:NmrA/HSCARG family protein [Thermoplasmata archaeon]
MTDHSSRRYTSDSTPPKKTILVSGVTGAQGGAVAQSLLHRGFTVRGLSRDPSKLAPSRFAGITMVKGDLLENRSLIGALHGVDGFFIVTTPFIAGWGQPPNIDSEIKAGFTALEAAKEAGTSHVVLSTVASAGFVHEPTGIGHFDSKVRIEEKARQLSVPLTIVRPSYFMENHLNPWALQGIRGGAISMPVKTTTRIQMVAVRDIGEIVARAFESPEKRIGTAADLAGDKKTLPEVADLFSKKLGVPVKYVEMADSQAAQQLGEDALNMYRGFDRGVPNIDIPALEQDWAIRMTRLEDLFRETELTP